MVGDRGHQLAQRIIPILTRPAPRRRHRGRSEGDRDRGPGTRARRRARRRAAARHGAPREATYRRAMPGPRSPRRAPPSPAAGPPAEIGEWTEAPFRMPTYAINSAVLPTGKVMFWGRPPPPAAVAPPPNVGEAALWSPWLGTGPEAFKDVPPPVVDVDGPGSQPPARRRCSAPGVVAAQRRGGRRGWHPGLRDTLAERHDEAFRGLAMMFTFDPFSETWIRQPDMAEGRWYPTQIMLPDGRTVIAGGWPRTRPAACTPTAVELFNPPAVIGGQGTVERSRVPTAMRGGSTSTRACSPLGEDVLLAGPRGRRSGSSTPRTSPGTTPARHVPGSPRRQRRSPPRRPQGLGDLTHARGLREVRAQRAVLPGYRNVRDHRPPPSPPPGHRRATQRPQGQLEHGAAAGRLDGRGRRGQRIRRGQRRRVRHLRGRPRSPGRDLRSRHPTAGGWARRSRRTAPITRPRCCCPTAGCSRPATTSIPWSSVAVRARRTTAEIYSPPYLFEGPRPVIDSAPEAVDWGDASGSRATAPEIERAVLIAPGATTHGVDMNQRHVELAVLEQGRR